MRYESLLRALRPAFKRGTSAYAKLLTPVLSICFMGCTETTVGSRDGASVGEDPPDALSPSSAVVDGLTCPALGSFEGKISHEAYLRDHPQLTHAVTISLKEIIGGTAPGANAQSESVLRDQDLSGRTRLNAKQVQCIANATSPRGTLQAPRPNWYEPIRVNGQGLPVPIATSFSMLALLPQIEALARHPYVLRVEPAFGEAAKFGLARPQIPSECPAASEPPDPKTMDAAAIRLKGRRPVVIEMRDELFPKLESCVGLGTCHEQLSSAWARTIVARRMLTCVQTWIESRVEGAMEKVQYAAADGFPSGYPPLPPFADEIHATLAIGLTLTWAEVGEVAKHPYVKRVWTSDALAIERPPSSCPPNYGQSVETRVCSGASEPIETKLSANAKSQWEMSGESQDVIISVRREGVLCPRPECPGREVECPELTRYNERLTEEAVASQSCVRALIINSGGTVTDDVFVLGNALLAKLTWAQIQLVAAHPHVGMIEARFTGQPPP